MAQPRDQSSRFRSSYNVGQLPGLVRAIALIADPIEPLNLTQRRFDESRFAAGHPDAPSARQICVRLDRAWREVLKLALEQPSPDRALGQGDAEARELLDEMTVTTALRAVFGSGVAAAPDDYECGRARLLRADRRRRHGGRLSLPTAAQIVGSLGSWNAALALIGVEPRQYGGATHNAEPLLSQLERYLEAEGALPGKRELARWLRARDESMARPPARWQEALDRLRDTRTARGLWTPTRATRHGRSGRPRKDASPAPGPAPEVGQRRSSSRRRRRRSFSREQCEAAIRRFLAWLPSSERPTQRAYREFCRQHPGTPWPSSFAQFGGWGALRDRQLSRGFVRLDGHGAARS